MEKKSSGLLLEKNLESLCPEAFCPWFKEKSTGPLFETELIGLFGRKSQGLFGRKTHGLFGTKSQGLFGTKSQGLFGRKSQGLFGIKSQGSFGIKSQGLFGIKSQGLFGIKSQGLFGIKSTGPSLFPSCIAYFKNGFSIFFGGKLSFIFFNPSKGFIIPILFSVWKADFFFDSYESKKLNWFKL